MKIALYIEDGLEQIVLTPQTDTEKAILGKLTDGERKVSIHSGEFYACQGGWTRHRRSYSESPFGGSKDESTIIVLAEPESNVVDMASDERRSSTV